MAFTCSPIPTIKLSSPLDKYVNVYYNYYTQFCQSDLIKKWNHETFLFMTSKKGKYVLEFEINIGLPWVLLFFVGNSSCMRNTYYAKIHGQFFFPLLKVFPFNSSEWHCNHLLVRVLTLLHSVLPTLKSLQTYYISMPDGGYSQSNFSSTDFWFHEKISKWCHSYAIQYY